MKRTLSLGDLMNLFLAWEAGEASEGRVVELTGLDRVTLRTLKQNAIEAGAALTIPTEAEMRELHATYGVPCTPETTTAPESSSPAATDKTGPAG